MQTSLIATHIEIIWKQLLCFLMERWPRKEKSISRCNVIMNCRRETLIFTEENALVFKLATSFRSDLVLCKQYFPPFFRD